MQNKLLPTFNLFVFVEPRWSAFAPVWTWIRKDLNLLDKISLRQNDHDSLALGFWIFWAFRPHTWILWTIFASACYLINTFLGINWEYLKFSVTMSVLCLSRNKESTEDQCECNHELGWHLFVGCYYVLL